MSPCVTSTIPESSPILKNSIVEIPYHSCSTFAEISDDGVSSWSAIEGEGKVINSIHVKRVHVDNATIDFFVFKNPVRYKIHFNTLFQ